MTYFDALVHIRHADNKTANACVTNNARATVWQRPGRRRGLIIIIVKGVLHIVLTLYQSISERGIIYNVFDCSRCCGGVCGSGSSISTTFTTAVILHDTNSSMYRSIQSTGVLMRDARATRIR